MRLPYYSLKTGIFIILVIILLAAMILLDIVMVSMAEKDMVRLEIKNGVMLLQSIEEEIRSGFNKNEFNRFPHQRLKCLLDNKHLLSAVILNLNGKIVFETKTAEVERKRLLSMARKSIKSGENSFSVPDLSWGILPSSKGYCFIAYPVMDEAKVIAAASAKIPLENI